ncbi:MAG: hypothetical protein GXP05_13920 [Alphaproteobacteria bacterium]|nr:hypothetical protein [Alphaproteobacteria bacterium]
MAGDNIDEFRRILRQVETEQPDKPRAPRYKKSTGRSFRGIRMPWALIFHLVILMFLLKAFVVLQVGEGNYRRQLATYRNPAIAQQIGIFVMSPDPITLKLRDLFKPVVNRLR